MADSLTVNYGLVKPEIGGSYDSWGQKANGNFDIIDTRLKVTFDLAGAAMPKGGGTFTGAVTIDRSGDEKLALVGSATPYLGFYGATTGTRFGYLQMGAGSVTLATDATNGSVRFFVGGVERGAISASGLDVSGVIRQGGNQVWHAGNLASPASTVSPVLTGTPTAPTPTAGTNTTQLATTAYVVAAINALVNGAPGALDQLNELAAAMGNDPNFATTMLNALAGKQASLGFTPANRAGDTFTGAILRDAGFGLDLVSGRPRIMLDTGDYLEFDRAADKLTFYAGGVARASIDSTGTIRAAGFIGGVTP